VRAFLLVPVLLSVALVLAALDEKSGLATWLKLHRELEASHERIEQLQVELEVLRADVVALETEPFAIERAIREDLGLVKPGETVVYFVDPEGDGDRPLPKASFRR